MSFLSRLFGSRDRGEGDLESRLEALEKEAREARPGYVGSAYNRAGDLSLRHGLEGRALGFYGRAIDAFLEDSQREAARGVANKIIRVRPTAVRALCTLTWLDLASRHQAMALLHLRDYVSAARDAEEHARTATQIHRMASMSADEEFLNAVADALDSLDYGNRAREVRDWGAEGGPNHIEDEDALSRACVTAAITSNAADAELLSDDMDGSDGREGADAGASGEGVEEEK